MKKHIKEVSSAGISASSDTEPDFGNWLAGGNVRELGIERNKDADAWFRNGGYTQTDYPKADFVWGGDYTELTPFNLDPGIYRISSQQRLNVPDSWASLENTSDDETDMEKNNVADDEDFTLPTGTDSTEPDNFKVPQYKDFFS